MKKLLDIMFSRQESSLKGVNKLTTGRTYLFKFLAIEYLFGLYRNPPTNSPPLPSKLFNTIARDEKDIAIEKAGWRRGGHQAESIKKATIEHDFWHPRGWIKNTYYTNHQPPRCL